jgi:hypothetical protein
MRLGVYYAGGNDMTKVIYEYDLYEDKEDLQHTQHAVDYYLALVDLAQLLRQKDKYGEDGDSVTWEEMRKIFYGICEDRDVKDVL